MWRAGVSQSEPTGLAAYLVVEALAAEQISLGHDVVVDVVNAVEEARAQWRDLARWLNTELRFIEVRCSDPGEHRGRLERRSRGIAGFREPTWADVQRRREEFAPWADDKLTLDSMDPRESNLRVALEYLDRPAG